MANKNPTADEAISQCFAALMQGVVPCTVKQSTLDEIRTRFYQTFKHLLDGKRKWSKDGPRVIRTAYYLGTIAGFCAFANSKDEATSKDFFAALDFVQPRCKIGLTKTPRGDAQVRYIWCE